MEPLKVSSYDDYAAFLTTIGGINVLKIAFLHLQWFGEQFVIY